MWNTSKKKELSNRAGAPINGSVTWCYCWLKGRKRKEKRRKKGRKRNQRLLFRSNNTFWISFEGWKQFSSVNFESNCFIVLGRKPPEESLVMQIQYNDPFLEWQVWDPNSQELNCLHNNEKYFPFFVGKVASLLIELLGEKCFLNADLESMHYLYIMTCPCGGVWMCVLSQQLPQERFRRSWRTKLACLSSWAGDTVQTIYVPLALQEWANQTWANYWYRIFRFWWIHESLGQCSSDPD